MLCLDYPQRLARVRGTHMMVKPKSWSGLLFAESNNHFSASRALHVNVGRLVLARRRVHVDAERTFFVHLDHAAIYNPSLGYVHSPTEECLTKVCC